jgi:hypothetical protein
MSIINVQTKKNLQFLLGFFLILFFSFSALNIFLFSRSLDRWIFIFYNTERGKIEREVRYLEPVGGREESLKLMVKEILLGSFNPLYLPLWERDTPLLSLFLTDNRLYVNVGGALLKQGETSLIYLQDIIKLNVEQNFSFSLEEVILAVEGETWQQQV